MRARSRLAKPCEFIRQPRRGAMKPSPPGPLSRFLRHGRGGVARPARHRPAPISRTIQAGRTAAAASLPFSREVRIGRRGWGMRARSAMSQPSLHCGKMSTWLPGKRCIPCSTMSPNTFCLSRRLALCASGNLVRTRSGANSRKRKRRTNRLTLSTLPRLRPGGNHARRGKDSPMTRWTVCSRKAASPVGTSSGRLRPSGRATRTGEQER